MDIQWHGLSCFTFKGKSATLVTDPCDSKLAGVKMPKIEPDIVCANEDNNLHHAIGELSGKPICFDWPGEYEAKGIIIQAIPAFDRPREKDEKKSDDAKKVLVYLFLMDGFRVCHLSNVGHKLTTEMLEMIGDVDILLVPIGGKECLNAEKAHEVIEQIDPRIVIPMYYKTPGVKMDLAELEPFLKEMGIHSPAQEKVLKFTVPSALPQEHTEFKILEAVAG